MKNIIRVPIERTCKMCGNIYESTAARSCYCSGACRREYETAYARDYRNKHRAKITKYNREYWRRTHCIENIKIAK